MRQIIQSICDRVENSDPQYMAFGIFGLINYPSFFFFWTQVAPQPYTSLLLRLVACGLCVPLVFHDKWPKTIKPFLPLYWLFTLLFSLPYFGSYMFLKNEASTMWLMNITLAFFLLILLVDWILFVVLTSLGIALGALTYMLLTDGHIDFLFNNYVFSAIATYVWAVVIGIAFSHNTEKNLENKHLREQLKTARIISSSIAHELRTPLNSIRFGLNGLEKYLPKLFKAYEVAKEQKFDIPLIRNHHYDVLKGLTDTIQREIYESNTIINMLLVNVNPNVIDSESFDVLSMQKIIESAMDRYPFSSEKEFELVHIDKSHDFKFSGVQQYMIHIIFNLLKNALYYISAERKGDIHIKLNSTEHYHELTFTDTSKGIAPSERKLLFREFYSAIPNGTGVGLAFCKLAIEKMGGRISCDSEEGKFTKFILHFPKMNEPALQIDKD